MARDSRDDELTDEQLAADEHDAVQLEQRHSQRREGKAGRRRPLLFLQQVMAELRKVVWPTRQELTTYSLVVIVFVSIVMAFLFLLDFAFGKATFWLFA